MTLLICTLLVALCAASIVLGVRAAIIDQAPNTDSPDLHEAPPLPLHRARLRMTAKTRPPRDTARLSEPQNLQEPWDELVGDYSR